jgi:hypothetical protein
MKKLLIAAVSYWAGGCTVLTAHLVAYGVPVGWYEAGWIASWPYYVAKFAIGM